MNDVRHVACVIHYLGGNNQQILTMRFSMIWRIIKAEGWVQFVEIMSSYFSHLQKIFPLFLL
jgi:hypothetical protein